MVLDLQPFARLDFQPVQHLFPLSILEERPVDPEGLQLFLDQPVSLLPPFLARSYHTDGEREPGMRRPPCFTHSDLPEIVPTDPGFPNGREELADGELFVFRLGIFGQRGRKGEVHGDDRFVPEEGVRRCKDGDEEGGVGGRDGVWVRRIDRCERFA